MGRVGWVDPVVQSREVLVGLRQTVRSVEYTRRVSPIFQRAAWSMILTWRGGWPGFQSTFPGVFAGTAQNWPSGSLTFAISNLTWPSVVCCGLQNLGLSHHATLPSLLPGLDKVGVLQHISLVLTFHKVSSCTAYLRHTSSVKRITPGLLRCRQALTR
jgi:hypothetical protein